MDKNQKAPRWIFKSFLVLIIIGVLILAFHFERGPLSKIAGYQSADASSNVWNQNSLELNLVPGEWSKKVVIQDGTYYRITSDVDTKVCFQDGFCSNIGPSHKDAHYGIRIGTFKFRSDYVGRVTITVKH
jgi:hypothetical protein